MFGSESCLRMNLYSRKIEQMGNIEEGSSENIVGYANKVYIPSFNKDEILIYDLSNNVNKKIRLESYNTRFNTILLNNNKVILSGNDKKICIFDILTNKTELVDIPQNWSARTGAIDEFAFRQSVLFGEKVLFLPARMDYVMLFDPDSKEWSKLFSLEEGERSANYAQIDGIGSFVITESYNDYCEPLRVFEILEDESVKECEMFCIPEEIDVKVGMNESKLYTLNRFINNVIDL